MQIYRRLLLTVALSTFITACGGTESDPGNLAETTSEARGGKKGGGGTTPTPTPTDASVTAANSVFDGYTTVKLYAGSWTNQQLWVAVRCYQGGALVYDASNGFELHYGVQAGIAGYSFAGDHFERIFGGTAAARTPPSRRARSRCSSPWSALLRSSFRKETGRSWKGPPRSFIWARALGGARAARLLGHFRAQGGLAVAAENGQLSTREVKTRPSAALSRSPTQLNASPPYLLGSASTSARVAQPMPVATPVFSGVPLQ